MAAFIEIEWGNTAYLMMKRIKELFDPKTLLNPGVIINDDAQAHLKNLKGMPGTNEIVDKCIECGFCEPTCPSNEITLTPRQRITVNREISKLEKEGNLKEANEYKELYQYDGIETCATCSLCSTTCPVHIDTGSLTKHLRAEQISPRAHNLAFKVANNFSGTLKGMKIGLGGANLVHSILGTASMETVTSTLRDWSGGKIPKWSPYLPRPTSINTKFEQKVSSKKIVYFPSCISRSMGRNAKTTVDEELFDITVKLLKKAGFQIIFPNGMDSLCCGMPFSSKGFNEQAKQKSNELEHALNEVSNFGEYPVLCDTSPCTKTMIQNFDSNIKIYEPIEFALELLVPELEFKKIDEPIAIHTTCSSRKMGLHEKFIELANICSTKVIVPENVKCCGFAGDRGFNFPELNDSALRFLSEEVKEAKFAFSTSKTCEIGLSEHANLDYNSIFYLIDKTSKAKNI